MTTPRLFLGLTSSGQKFTLPADLVSQSTAVLAKRRVGKSYLAGVIAEELLTRGQPVVIVDPTGAHWGLRASADGKKPGFPIVVVGGKHADLPLEEGGGEALARAIVEQRFSAIVDTSLLTKGATLRFLDAFLGTLYQVNEKNLLLLLDEVDYYCPQKPATPQHAITAAHVDDLVRRGGIKGIGVVLVTQRSAVVSKDVLTQCEVLITLRLVHPIDIKVITDWVGVHGDPAQAKRMMESLPALPVGHAWVWWPSEDIFERIIVREKTTFDSGRTPKPGEHAARPRVLAKVDLAQLGERMKTAAEAAKANDPRELKKQLAAAQQKIRSLEAARPAPAPKAAKPVVRTELKTVKVPVLRSQKSWIGLLKTLGAFTQRLEKESQLLLKAIEAIGDGQIQVLEALEKQREHPVERVVIRGVKDPDLNIDTRVLKDLSIKAPEGESSLGTPEQRVLDAVAWWEVIGVYHPTSAAVAPVANYSVKSSSFEKARGALVTKKLLSLENGTISLTAMGRGMARREETPPTTQALHQRVLATLSGPEQKLLTPLLAAYPKHLAAEALATASGYSVKSSSFEKARGALGSKGLVTIGKGTVIATEILFPGEG